MKITDKQKEIVHRAVTWMKTHKELCKESVEYTTRLDEKTIEFIREHQPKIERDV